MLKINVSELRKETGASHSFSGVLPDISLELQGMVTKFCNLRFTGEVSNTGSEIYLRGTLESEAELICGRCLNLYKKPFRLPLEETYYRNMGTEVGEEDEEPGRIYSGDEIDLDEIIQEALVLAIPMKPVCSPDCAGLCPVCGADRNTVRCDCRTETIDPRLSALLDFKKGNN